jgi:hypothetical protein
MESYFGSDWDKEDKEYVIQEDNDKGPIVLKTKDGSIEVDLNTKKYSITIV